MTTKSLNQLRDECYQTSKDHGFHDTSASFGDRIALIHSELSEALEDYRNHKNFTEVWYEEKPYGMKPCGIPSEIADVIIRCFDLAGIYKIDIEKAVLEKMEFNKKRPHRHEGKKI